jgi:hypothetical protein
VVGHQAANLLNCTVPLPALRFLDLLGEVGLLFQELLRFDISEWQVIADS